MRDGRRVGQYFEVFEAPGPHDASSTINVGIPYTTFQRLARHKLATMIAQYYGIVQDGLTNTTHLFQGLKRPLLVGDNMRGDEGVLVYSWRPAVDFIWLGDRNDGNPRQMQPPGGRVFVVLVRDDTPADAHGVSGTIEHWNWVHEDPGLPGAPVNWEQRYSRKVWSR